VAPLVIERTFDTILGMPDVSFQGSLFSGVAEAGPFDADFSGIDRIELDQGAWIERQAGWATDPDRLFVTALDALDWREGTEPTPVGEVPRPRLVASFDRPDLPEGLGVFREMSTALSERYGVDLVRITCNLYRDGRDSVAWHGDRVARDLPEATVAIVSLGEPRPFKVRPKGGGPSMGWPAGRGDLFVMGGSCQRTYDHAIPKVASAGPRIAVMFRHFYT
jgi:alkylated DNA repair dioxygenase AlkB